MSERTCIATGKILPRHNMLKFVVGPDGFATLDLAEKLPGRCAWVAAEWAALQQAVTEGHFKRVIGARCSEIDEETICIKHLMHDRVIACAGMARRAGFLIGGVGKLLAGLLAPEQRVQENLCRKLHLEIARIEGFYASVGCNQKPDGCIT